MNTTYLLLGSNMGDSKQKLLDAKKNITKNIGSINRQSGLYQTAAWGKTDQSAFLNQALEITTELNARQLIRNTDLGIGVVEIDQAERDIHDRNLHPQL